MAPSKIFGGPALSALRQFSTTLCLRGLLAGLLILHPLVSNLFLAVLGLVSRRAPSWAWFFAFFFGTPPSSSLCGDYGTNPAEGMRLETSRPSTIRLPHEMRARPHKRRTFSPGFENARHGAQNGQNNQNKGEKRLRNPNNLTHNLARGSRWGGGI